MGVPVVVEEVLFVESSEEESDVWLVVGLLVTVALVNKALQHGSTFEPNAAQPDVAKAIEEKPEEKIEGVMKGVFVSHVSCIILSSLPTPTHSPFLTTKALFNACAIGALVRILWER